MSILVFDSGIGGLTVLREVRVLMPEQHFVYAVDDAAFPYGDWEEAGLTQRMLDVFEGLVARHTPDMIIVACNTASTLILPYLREKYAFPIVGTVPAIKPAAERTASGQVSVLATPGTVQRQYTRGLIKEFASMTNVRLVGSDHLADLAETFMLTGKADEEAISNEIRGCFVDVHGARTDIVVLGCTHYPLLTNVMRRLAPWPVDWLNPAEPIARHARSLIPASDEVSLEQDIAVFSAGMPSPERRRLLAGFGLQSQAMDAPPVQT